MRLCKSVGCVFAALCVSAQTPEKPRSFDVASIRKIDGPCSAGPPLRITPGRIVLHCFNARQLIATAYNPLGREDHTHIPVIGLPSSMESVRYDIEAKADKATGTEMMGVLLLGLLKERFHLQIHREPKDTPVYLLTVADRGPRLKLADPSACVVRDLSDFPPPLQSPGKVCGTKIARGASGIQTPDFYSVSMETFAADLTNVGRPVVDRTSLKGKYDIHLEFAQGSISSGPVMLNGEPMEPAGPDNSGETSIFTAIQKQLGLKLTAGTAPLDVIVVDRLDPPTDN